MHGTYKLVRQPLILFLFCFLILSLSLSLTHTLSYIFTPPPLLNIPRLPFRVDAVIYIKSLDSPSSSIRSSPDSLSRYNYSILNPFHINNSDDTFPTRGLRTPTAPAHLQSQQRKSL